MVLDFLLEKACLGTTGAKFDRGLVREDAGDLIWVGGTAVMWLQRTSLSGAAGWGVGDIIREGSVQKSINKPVADVSITSLQTAALGELVGLFVLLSCSSETSRLRGGLRPRALAGFP